MPVSQTKREWCGSCVNVRFAVMLSFSRPLGSVLSVASIDAQQQSSPPVAAPVDSDMGCTGMLVVDSVVPGTPADGKLLVRQWGAGRCCGSVGDPMDVL